MGTPIKSPLIKENYIMEREYDRFQQVLGKAQHWKNGEPEEMFLLKRIDGLSDLDVDITGDTDPIKNVGEMMFNTDFKIIEVLKSHDVESLDDVIKLMELYEIEVHPYITSKRTINCSNLFYLNEDLSITSIEDFTTGEMIYR
jgi:hypothetical protein